MNPCNLKLQGFFYVPNFQYLKVRINLKIIVMNRKRRVQSFSTFGLVRTKTYITSRVPKIAFEKVKTIYGNHLHGGQGEVQIDSFGKNSISAHVNKLISEEKRRQFISYLTHGILLFIAIIILGIIMSTPYTI